MTRTRRVNCHPQQRESRNWTLPPAPTSRRALEDLVNQYLRLSVPTRRVCPNHDSPMDYLAASFLGQEDLLVWANRGGGKTYLAAVATFLDACYRGPLKIRVLGGSFDQSDRLADYVRDLLTHHEHLLGGPMTRDRVRLAGGSDIRMLSQSPKAIRGQHVQKVRCDEVDLFDDEVWQAVQFVTRSGQLARGSLEVLSTLHRSGGLMQRLVEQACQDHRESGRGFRLVQWCLWEVIERCPPQRRCRDCPLRDDCRGLARKGAGHFGIDDAIAIHARSSRRSWETEMLCRGARRDWLVFEEFDPARHVSGVEYCPEWPTYRAIDFGYRSPLVCLWIQITPAGRVHVLQEYARQRLSLAQHAKAILAMDLGPAAATYVDPAGKQKESTSGTACTEMLAHAGIPCTCRASTIAEGLELLHCALAPAGGEPTIVVHPRCTRLVEAFNSYHYPAPESSAPRDKPVKDGPDHLIDALRYFFVNRMRPGGKVERRRY